MNPAKFCEQCGAQLAPNTKFCEQCGHPVVTPATAPTTVPPVATPIAPQTNAPRSSNRTLVIGLAVGVVALIACLALAAFGATKFLSGGAPVSKTTPTVQVALALSSMPTQAPLPTSAPPTMVSLSTTAQAIPPTGEPVAVPTTVPIIAPTAAPTILPTSVPTVAPTAAPTLPPGVLFQDDFSSVETSVQNGWDFAPQESTRYVWSPNQITFSGSEANKGLENVLDGKYQDFAIETEAELTQGASAWLGLVFRYNQNADTADYYDLSVRSDGQYTLWLVQNGAGVDPALIPIEASNAIHPGRQRNTLGVIAEGDTISIYINRVPVKTIRDNHNQGSGSVGVYAGTRTDPAMVTFHRFTVLTPEQAHNEWGAAAAVEPGPITTSTPSVPKAPPGVYLTGLRVQPANPVRSQGVRFVGKFLNNTGAPQSMNWLIMISEPGAKKAFGETSVAGITIPVGISEIASPDNWRVTGGGGCISFNAQAFSVNPDNSRALLQSTTGNAVSAGFKVCP